MSRPRNHRSPLERREEARQRVAYTRRRPMPVPELKPAAEPYILQVDGRELYVSWCPAMRIPIPRQSQERE